MTRPSPTTLRARHAITGRKLLLTDCLTVPFNAGGWEEKNWLSGLVDGHPDQLVSFIERSHDYPAGIRVAVRNWRAYRQAGLPVPPDLYITDRPSVLLTDLKANPRREIYGKGLGRSLTEVPDLPTFRRRPAVDPEFLRLSAPGDGWRATEALLLACSALATRQQLAVPEDDALELGIVLNESGVGSAEAWMLDCVDPTINPYERPRDLARCNNTRTVACLGHLESLHRLLLAAPTASLDS